MADNDDIKKPLISEQAGPSEPQAEIGAGELSGEIPPEAGDGIESFTIAEGIQKILLKEGTGELVPELHAHCFVHYRAWVKRTLQKFQDTWAEGQTLQLTIGHEKSTLSGLALAVKSMKAGERSLFHVHSSLAYGKEGSFSFPHVPSESDVVYEVELIGFDNPREGRSVAEMTVEERIDAADRRRVDGNILFKEEKIVEAIQQYEVALGYMNDDFMFQMFGKYRDMANAVRLPCFLNLAACMLKLGRFEDAVGHCTVVLAEEPNNVKALFRRGKARAALGRSDSAREDLLKAKKLSPKDKAVVKELQALKEDDRSILEKQKKLYKGMFAADPEQPKRKPSWLEIIWQWVVSMLKSLWPFKGGSQKSKKE